MDGTAFRLSPNLMPDKKQINVRVPDGIQHQIANRANLLEESQGGYLGLIARWWYARGAPPVNESEADALRQKESDKNSNAA